MKNTTTSKIIIIALWAIFLASCSNDELILEEPETTFPDPVELLESSLTGSVEDESGLPISEALVTCLSCVPVQEVLTDEKGDFQFFNIAVKGGSAYLSVTSAGKFDGFRRLGLIEKRINYTKILLKDKISLGTLSAEQGGVLNDNTGAVISLPANGIVDAAGQSYSGDYDVFLSWIDPTSDDLNLRMVGDLSAIDSEGELVGLSTYGMLQVELEAADGSELNIAEGNTAILEFPVPQSLRTSAPAIIPLWNYDESNGYWVEEGSATLDGDKYVGEVSHFSTWNVDVIIDPVEICGSIVTLEFTKRLSYFQVRLGGDSFSALGGWLCDDGSFRFINVPSREILTLEVLNYCGELIESISLGPYEPGKIELGPIIVNGNIDITFINLTGNATDCDNEALTEGMVIINLQNDSYFFPIESDGSFDVNFPTCGAFEGTVQILNTGNTLASVTINISDKTPEYNFEKLQACDVLPEQYFYYKFESNSFGLTTVERLVFDSEIIYYFLNSGQYTLIFDDRQSRDYINLGFGSTPVQDTEQIVNDINVRSGSFGFSFPEIKIHFKSVGPEISPGIFEYIEGTFESPESMTNYINGTFRVKPQ